MAKISTKDLVAQYEKGVPYEEIAMKFNMKPDTVYRRIHRYYKKLGLEKPNFKVEIKIEDLVKLKEDGFSDEEISRYYENLGVQISPGTVWLKLKEYYVKYNRKKPRVKPKISDEELVELKEKGYSCEAIADFFTKKGKKICGGNVATRLRKYYANQGKKMPQCTVKGKITKDRQYEDDLKEILMSGMSIEEFVFKFGKDKEQENIRRQLIKLRHSAKCQKDGKREFSEDNKFISIIDLIENRPEAIQGYRQFVSRTVESCKDVIDKIDEIKRTCFNDNENLMMYIILGMDLEFKRGYDSKIYKILIKQYEQKIDEYLKRMYSVEKNRMQHLPKDKTVGEVGNLHEEI